MATPQRTPSILRPILYLGMLFLLAACSSAVEVDTQASADQPYATLRSAVSPCPNGPPSADTPFTDVFARVEAWYRVDNYSDTPIPIVGSEPGEIEAVSLESNELVTLDIVGNPGAEASVAWGVGQASALYLGVDSIGRSDYASVVIAELPDGSVFFPGECVEEGIGDPLRGTLGDDEYSRFIQTALELIGADLEHYVSTPQG